MRPLEPTLFIKLPLPVLIILPSGPLNISNGSCSAVAGIWRVPVIRKDFNLARVSRPPIA
jgi:hypothetical protein